MDCIGEKGKMLTYFEALKTVLEAIDPLDTEEKPVSQTLGQVLARDTYSDVNLPTFDISSADGYAVKAEDIQKASKNSPVALNVLDTLKAGSVPHRRLEPRSAIRVVTASILPAGADCVVKFEHTDEANHKKSASSVSQSQVRIYVNQSTGMNIIRSGYFIRKGSMVVPRGIIIGPAQLAALIAIGKSRVKVIRRPVVAIITTGDELVKPGKPLPPGKTYDCNAEAIAALISHYGGIPRILGIARDNEKSVMSKMQKGMAADAIITTGGVSDGESGLVRRVIRKMGKEVFSRIKMGPGASFAFGMVERDSSQERLGQVPVFALSGSPVGYLNDFEVLVRPAVLKMKGVTALNHPLIEARAEDSISGKSSLDFIKRTDLKRSAGGYKVSTNTADGVLASLSTTNSLVIIPEGTEIRAGEIIPVWPLDWS
jgi:molybdopterin molybdotransferase